MRLHSLTLILFLASTLLVLGTLASACEVEPESDADMEPTTSPADMTAGCTPACATGETCTAGVCVPPGDLDYRFVRIDDVSANGDTIDAGADIDAVVLTKDGVESYASTVEAFEQGGDGADALNPNNALGTPDAFFEWPDVTNCDVTTDADIFVSLGGNGGYLILGFNDIIETGDTIEVLEVGDCAFNNGNNNAIPDDVEVSVSVSNDVTSNWVFVGSGSGPVVAIDVPALPSVPAE